MSSLRLGIKDCLVGTKNNVKACIDGIFPVYVPILQHLVHFHDAAQTHQYSVRVHDSVQPMSYCDDCALSELLTNGLLDNLISSVHTYV